MKQKQNSISSPSPNNLLINKVTPLRVVYTGVVTFLYINEVQSPDGEYEVEDKEPETNNISSK